MSNTMKQWSCEIGNTGVTSPGIKVPLKQFIGDSRAFCVCAESYDQAIAKAVNEAFAGATLHIVSQHGEYGTIAGRLNEDTRNETQIIRTPITFWLYVCEATI